MADVRQVNPDLMFAPGLGNDTKQSEPGGGGAAGQRLFKPALDGKLSPGGESIGPHAIFHGNAAALVFAKGELNYAGFLSQMPVHNSEVLLLDLAIFPKAAQFAGGVIRFGNDGHSAGFAIEPIYQVRVGLLSQMEAHPADEAGHFVGLRGMTHEPRRFIDDQQFVVFVDDVEERAHIFFWR